MAAYELIKLPATHQKNKEDLCKIHPYFPKHEATAHVGSTIRIRVSERQTAGYTQYASGTSCNWSTRSWFSVVFLQQMLSWYTNSTLHCMLLMQPSPTLMSKSSPKRSPLNGVIFRPDTASNAKRSPNAQLLPVAQYSQPSGPSTLPSSLRKTASCFEPTFTGRTSGHCLGTLTAANVFCFPF
jgi:hypothetical protein